MLILTSISILAFNSLARSFLRLTHHVGPWKSREGKMTEETPGEMREEVRIYTKQGTELL